MAKPLGFFDSGVGGLSVLRYAMQESSRPLVYLGDTARMPYGVRPPEEVIAFAVQAVEKLATYDPKAVILACNTASSYAIPTLRARFPFPIVGVVEPGCRAAVKATRTGKIALLATPGTVKSGSYQARLHEMDLSLEVVGVGAPDLVLAVEAGHMDDAEADAVVGRYLGEFGAFDYDTLILGCTHFPLATPAFARALEGRNVHLVDPGSETMALVPGAEEAAGTASETEQPQFAAQSTEESEVAGRQRSLTFLTTGSVAQFRTLAEQFLDLSQENPEYLHIDLQ